MADVSNSERKSKSHKTPKAPKKRPRNPEEWHKQKQKRLRIAGKEHINTNGKLIAEKKPGPDCRCRRRCFLRVPEQVRLKTFEGYYSLKTHDEQNSYLFGLMRQIDIKRKRKKDSSRRTCTFEYFVRVRGRETQVCQNAFKNIHAITERKIRVLCKKMDDGIMFPSDNRGKNSGNRAGEVRLAPEIIEQIKEHIFSIVHTHRLRDYIRLDKVTGLEINVSKMWKDYIKTYDPDYTFVTLSKGKKNAPQTEQPTTIIQNAFHQEIGGPSGNETFHCPLQYPGSGHLINIAENYFAQAMVTQAQYPSSHQHLSVGNYIHTDKMSYYQQGQVMVQPGGVQQLPPPHPHADTNTYVILQSMPNHTPESIKEESLDGKNKNKNDKKRGPAVKQWRYTSIFHEEINGSALCAIKNRLANYFSELETAKTNKKTPNKQPQPVQMQQVTITSPQQSLLHVYKSHEVETTH